MLLHSYSFGDLCLSFKGYPGGGNPPPSAPYAGSHGPYGSPHSSPYGAAAGQPGGHYGGGGVPGHGGQYGHGQGGAPSGHYGGYGGQQHHGAPYGHHAPAGNYRLTLGLCKHPLLPPPVGVEQAYSKREEAADSRSSPLLFIASSCVFVLPRSLVRWWIENDLRSQTVV